MGYSEFILIVNAAAELQRKVWIPRFIGLFAAMFMVGMVCYALWPRTDALLLQLLTVIIMGYLLYAELAIALFERYRKDTVTTTVAAEAEAEFIATEVKPQPQPEADNGKEEMQKLEQYARQVEEYLRTSEVYVNPNLSLKDVATATGISSKNLSKSINATLGKNFFDNSVMSVRQWLAVLVVMIFWWAFAEKELTNSNKVNWARASVILLTAFVIAVALLGGILLFGWYIQNH